MRFTVTVTADGGVSVSEGEAVEQTSETSSTPTDPTETTEP